MRRISMVAVVTGVVAVGLAPGASATAAIRQYGGTTSQGQPVAFTTVVRDGTVRLAEADFGFDMTCDDGSTFGLGAGFGFGPGVVPIPDGRVDFDDVFVFQAFHLHGRLGAHGGSGTVAITLPAFDVSEQPQACRSGDLTWQVRRTKQTAHPPSVRPGQTTLRISTTDRVSAVRLSSPGDPPAPLRSYHGRNGQGYPLVVSTFRNRDTVAVEEADFGFDLTCADGTLIGAGVGFFFGGFLKFVDTRIDFDVNLFDALFHWHGRLGVHTGSGTVSFALAGLDQNEQPMACPSGEQPWRAWRTDPGKLPAARPLDPDVQTHVSVGPEGSLHLTQFAELPA